MIGYMFGVLLGGAVVTESIFNWPGIGRYAVLTGVKFLDFPAIMGVTLISGIAFVLVNVMMDIAYAFIDPRIKMG
jgi:peptide/nickel transport system permease protein